LCAEFYREQSKKATIPNRINKLHNRKQKLVHLAKPTYQSQGSLGELGFNQIETGALYPYPIQSIGSNHKVAAS